MCSVVDGGRESGDGNIDANDPIRPSWCSAHLVGIDQVNARQSASLYSANGSPIRRTLDRKRGDERATPRSLDEQSNAQTEPFRVRPSRLSKEIRLR